MKNVLYSTSPLSLPPSLCRAKLLLGGCVCVAEEAVGVFSRAMLLYSLVDSWLEGDDDSSSFAQIM